MVTVEIVVVHFNGPVASDGIELGGSPSDASRSRGDKIDPGEEERSTQGVLSTYPGIKLRGMSLAFVLVVVTLAVVTALILAGTSTAHLGFAGASSDRMRARNLAHAAVEKALAKLREDPTFGLHGESLELTLPGDPATSYGYLTFSKASARSHSTYNLNNDNSVPGFQGRVVPGHSIHLVGVGCCGDVVRTAEVILELSPFPYALASSGPIESSGELLVGALDTQSGLEPDSDNLLPAHLASNHTGDESVVLRGHTMVVGDLRSAGGFKLDDSVIVRGEKVPFGDPVTLPKIDVRSYDPAYSGHSYQELPAFTSGLRLNGIFRSTGDLNVLGDLRLDNATLYVNGKVTIQGAVVGQGMLASAQGVEIRDGARMFGNHAVLLSQGDVTILGRDSENSFFEGFVYTEGEFVARSITVVGSFVSRGERARVLLSDVRVVGDASKTKWNNPERRGLKVTAGTGEGETAGGQAVASDYEADGQFAVSGADGDTLYLDVNANLTNSKQGQNLPERSASEDFDLSRFLGVSDQMRVVLWKEL